MATNETPSHSDNDSPVPPTNPEGGNTSKLSCVTYMQYWVAGVQGPFVRNHVENCTHCLTVLFGDGVLWKETIEEEADRLVARSKRRRTFLKAAAAGVLAVAAGIWGVQTLTATRNAPTTLAGGPSEANLFARFEQAWATGGDGATRKMMATADDKTLRSMIDWIVESGHASLYGDVVSFVGDVRPAIKMRAINRLGAIPPAALKPWLGALTSFEAAETDLKLKANLSRLNTMIAKS